MFIEDVDEDGDGDVGEEIGNILKSKFSLLTIIY